MTFQIDGVVPIIPTPFHADDEVAYEEFGGLIDFAVAAGACAVCLPAYASEFYKLSEEERADVVEAAVTRSAGRIPVIAQVNSPSLKLAIAGAHRARKLGASAMCSAVPRIFGTSEDALFAYFDALLSEADLPFVLQDFNPSGPSVSVAFVERLHKAHPHFRYIKLEEPSMAAKIAAIRDATGGGVQVLEGWGGMYTLELAEAGVAGVVPGLALTDLLVRIFRLAKTGQREEALPLFQGILPQIVYSLQNMELFHHAEKRLLRARGLLSSTRVRPLAWQLSTHDEAQIQLLNRDILSLLSRFEMPIDPRTATLEKAAG